MKAFLILVSGLLTLQLSAQDATPDKTTKLFNSVNFYSLDEYVKYDDGKPFRFENILYNDKHNKEELFDKTKKYVLSYLVGSGNSISYSNKDEGIINIKGEGGKVSEIKNNVFFNIQRSYKDNYSLSFQFKDGRLRIVMSNIHRDGEGGLLLDRNSSVIINRTFEEVYKQHLMEYNKEVSKIKPKYMKEYEKLHKEIQKLDKKIKKAKSKEDLKKVEELEKEREPIAEDYIKSVNNVDERVHNTLAWEYDFKRLGVFESFVKLNNQLSEYLDSDVKADDDW